MAQKCLVIAVMLMAVVAVFDRSDASSSRYDALLDRMVNLMGDLYDDKKLPPNKFMTLQRKALIHAIIKKSVETGTTEQIIEALVKSMVQQQRMKKCIEKLGKAVCEHNVGFYIWAQMMAKEILEGTAVDN